MMTGPDQLGLFSYEKQDLMAKNSHKSVSLSFEVKPTSEQQIFDLIKKISKDIQAIDNGAKIETSIDEKKDWREMPFFAVDVETTGLDAVSNRIIEFAMVPFNMGDDVKPFCQLFSVGESLSQEIVNITGISDEMLRNQPPWQEYADACLRLMKRASFVVAYNAKFDRPFLESEMARLGKVLPTIPWVDPYIFVCEIDRFKRGKKLLDSARRWGVKLETAHRAQDDAKACGELLLKMADKIDCFTLDQLLTKQKILEWQNAHSMALLKQQTSFRVNR